MTNDEKQLLFKDLCARLPYGFTVHRYSDNRNITFEKNELDEFSHFLEYSEGEEFKPYLRPMSSMTEEEKKEFDEFVCVDEEAWNGDSIQGFINQAEIMSDGIDYLLAHHFDFRGLIEKGLALEAPEGMYKTE